MYKIKLSPYHKSFYYKWKCSTNSNQYNVVFDQVLDNNLDIKKLNKALCRFINDYIILGSHIIKVNNELYWVKNPDINNLEVFINGYTKQKIYNYVSKSFNLENGPLYRFAIFKRTDNNYRFIMVFHHIVIDNSCFDELIQEVSNYYNLDKYTTSYSFFQQKKLIISTVDWLDKKLANDENEYHNIYHKPDVKRLDLTFLKTSCNTLPKTLNNIKEYRFNFSEKQTSYILETLKELLITVPTYSRSVLATLLYRYTNQDKFAIGNKIALKNSTHLICGIQANTDIEIFEFNNFTTFSDLLKQDKNFSYPMENVTKKYYGYQLNHLSSSFNEELLDIIFAETNLQNIKFNFVNVKTLKINNEFNICIPQQILFETELKNKVLNYSIRYNALDIDKTILLNFINHYKNLFITALNDLAMSNKKLVRLYDILTTNEYQKIIYSWNNTSKPYPRNKTIHKLFEEQVLKTPNNIAVVYDKKILTYKELNQKANQLANYMKTICPINSEDLIALYLDRNEHILIAILAVLKCGAAYIPIDPNYPDARINDILEDSKPNILLTNDIYSERLSALKQLQFSAFYIIAIDAHNTLAKLQKQVSINLETNTDYTNLAYVIYTSGTTGKPKGVMIEHRQVNNFIYGMPFNQQANLRATFTAPYMFDVSVFDIWSNLLFGSAIFIVPLNLMIDTVNFEKFIIKNKINKIYLPASLLKLHLDSISKIEIVQLLTGVEKLESQDIPLLANVQEFINAYGPTETTVCSTAYVIPKSSNNLKVIPIGKPISNTRCYVLDRNLKPVPIGAIGELYIGGAGVSRGYLNRAELTAEKFIDNPFHTDKGNTQYKVIYKTGDLVRWLPNGNLEYIGRNDSQVKIRNYRIELGEIESKLCQYKKIKQAVVRCQNNVNGSDNLINNKILVAYYTLDKKYLDYELNNYLKSWVNLYDSLYDNLNIENYKYNVLGWNSSYTFKPISKVEITEFVDNTVSRIIDLNPKNILEIGSGSGLIMFNVLNICNKYIASDFSSASIKYLDKVIATKNLGSKISTVCCNAHELAKIDFEHKIDTIILNSVVQYFPNIDYLINVIKVSISKIDAKGKIFIGDVRDYRLLKLFHFSVLSYQQVQLSPELIDEHSLQDTELLISPKFFIYCKTLFNQIKHVDILPKYGTYKNEMNCFRYDVILHINNLYEDIPIITPIYSEDINSILNSTNSEEVFISYINKRIWKDHIKYNKLLGNSLDLPDTEPLSIEELHSVATNYGYFLKILFNVDNPILLNLIFYKIKPEYYHSDSIKLASDNFSMDEMSNNPVQKIEISNNEMAQSLEEYLLTQLPEYMVPKNYIKLSKIPLTSSGKIDYPALPTVKFIDKSTYISPKNDLEKKIIIIWSDILGISKEQIGTEDNFFKLGGNSLLVVRLKNKLVTLKEFKRITVPDLFKYTTIQQLTNFAKDTISSLPKIRLNTDSRFKLSDVAIIGMSGAFSGGTNLKDYWEQINRGKSGLTRHSINEFKDSAILHELLNHQDFVPVTGKILGTNEFDAIFWGMHPNEVCKLDPQIRKFLEHSWYVLEDSGYLIDRSAFNIGVFAGGRNSPDISDNKPPFLRHILGKLGAAKELTTQSSLAMQVSYMLGLTGISSNINTACSTSLVAIIEACKNIVAGYCDMAIAGGVSLILPSEYGYIYQNGGIFSKDGESRIFDSKSSGMVSGSGVGVVLLKSLERAIKDQDNIIAVIKGYNVNNDGTRKMTYTSPSVTGQVECISNAQKMARISFNEIDYVECHGTGTQLGDAIEIQALNETCKYDDSLNSITKKCYIGSVKANIGHAELAAGVAGLIKICKMLEHNIIPKQINYDSLNHNISLNNTPFIIPKSNKQWLKSELRHRIAGVSSFGIGGTNAHLVISDYIPDKHIKNNITINPEKIYNSKVNYILPLSAKSLTSLQEYKKNFINYLKTTKHNLSDIAYTLQLKRQKYQYRVSVVAGSLDEAIEKFENNKIITDVIIKNEHQNIVFMFPGQGSQYANMTLNLYQNDSKYKAILDKCLSIINSLLGISFENILFANNPVNIDTINQTQFAQLALFSVSYSLAKWLETLAIEPSVYLGHSIGELVAATLSGVFNLHDAIKIVIKRGKLMQSMAPGSMLLINASIDELINKVIYKHNCELAVINSPQQFVVSGAINNILKLKNQLEDKHISTLLLKVSHGYHSYLMEDAANKFVNEFKDIILYPPKQLFISNITGEFIKSEDVISPEYWSNHIRKKVMFMNGITTISEHFSNPFYIQVGPGQELLAFANQTCKKTINGIALIDKNHIICNQSVKEEIVNKLWLNGYNVNFAKYLDDNKTYKLVNLPNYCFDNHIYEFKDHYATINNPQIIRENKVGLKNKVQETNLVDQYYDIAKIFFELLPVSTISIHNSFFDLGGDSITALSLITKLKNIGVELNLMDIINVNSIAKIYKFANRTSDKINDKIIVPLLTNNQNKKVFFIHPIGGTVIQYLQIVKQLKNDYDYYGIQNINVLNVDNLKVDSLEKLSSIYLEKILEIQSTGEYIFMGSSLGGNIAYEISRQLVNLGKTVKYIVMFDSWARCFNNVTYTNIKASALEIPDYLNQSYVKDIVSSTTYNNLISSENHLLSLIIKYKPQKTNLKIYLFKADQISSEYINVSNSYNNFWQKYTDIPVTVYDIPGNHYTIYSNPGLSKIIDSVNNIL